jgi:hypothetical protein
LKVVSVLEDVVADLLPLGDLGRDGLRIELVAAGPEAPPPPAWLGPKGEMLSQKEGGPFSARCISWSRTRRVSASISACARSPRWEAGTGGGGVGWPLPPVEVFDMVSGVFSLLPSMLRRKSSPAVAM